MITTPRGGCHCGNIKVAFETALDPVLVPFVVRRAHAAAR
jgi:hypothetical protein